ncbi:MAG: DUF4399 domain-containing protein [Chitinophagaceae bacterium]|nr:DUF4399 domain-containing protein [Chitinophagaceae bacterium]
MKVKLFLTALGFMVFASCKNASDSKEATTDSTNQTEQHDMTENTTGVPDMPAIPEGAKVEFKNLKDNATISSPFTLQMGVENMQVDSAGPVKPGSGHHHLFIDGPDSLAQGTVVPKDSTHIHFGNAQTSYELQLTPGKHKLTLQFADGLHRSYGSQLSKTITVNIK